MESEITQTLQIVLLVSFKTIKRGQPLLQMSILGRCQEQGVLKNSAIPTYLIILQMQNPASPKSSTFAFSVLSSDPQQDIVDVHYSDKF